MTKIELWNELLDYNDDDRYCEICEKIPSYVIGLRGIVWDKYKIVWICKDCFFEGRE